MKKPYIRKALFDLERHNKDIFNLLGKDNIEKLKADKTIQQLYDITTFLENIGLVTKKEYMPLLQSLFYGLSKDNLTFFSLHSSALLSDPTKLREKPQYQKSQHLQKELDNFFSSRGIKFNYKSILPDYDISFPISSHDEAWDKNTQYIEAMSGLPTMRLSKMNPQRFEYIQNHLSSFLNIDELNKQIDYHAHSMSTILDFKAPENFSEKQIKTYSIIGLMLEEMFPFGILLDVQKKCYPFEQPFYNFARKHKLPIILCGQKIPQQIQIRSLSPALIAQFNLMQKGPRC